MWCWRRLLRVTWTARSSNQSILKEINPEYSLEGPMLKLKLQYFGHLMWRVNSLENTLMLGKIEDRRRKGRQMVRWHHWFNEHEFEQAPGDCEGQGSLGFCRPWGGVAKNWTQLRDWTTTTTRGACVSVIILKILPREAAAPRRMRNSCKPQMYCAAGSPLQQTWSLTQSCHQLYQSNHSPSSALLGKWSLMFVVSCRDFEVVCDRNSLLIYLMGLDLRWKPCNLVPGLAWGHQRTPGSLMGLGFSWSRVWSGLWKSWKIPRWDECADKCHRGDQGQEMGWGR